VRLPLVVHVVEYSLHSTKADIVTTTPFDSTKILRFPDRVARILRREPCPPVTVELDLTNHCNHRCPECAGGRRNGDSLGRDEAEKYLSQLVDVGCKAVTFTGGGEPLCHPAAVDLVQVAKGLGLDVGFITNGGLLSRTSIETLLQACCWIRVSLDASDPANYMRVHGRDRDEFYRVLRNISLLGECKAASTSQCVIGVGYLADKANCTGIPDLAKTLAGLGVNYLQIRPFHRRPEPMQEQVDAAKQHETADFHVFVSTDKYEHADAARQYTYCYGAEVCGVIQADSGVPLCCHLRGHTTTMLGRLREGKTFREIWYGSRKRLVLAELDVDQCIPLCRCDGINRTLHTILQPVEHPTFL